MKKLLGTISLLILLAPTQLWGGCSDAENSGFDCYRYALRAMRESSVSEIRKYAEKSRIAAEKALSHAEECACFEAERAFLLAFRSARNAVKSETVEQSKEQLQQVLLEAEAGTEAAEHCR